MDPETLRADPVLDNRPKLLGIGSQRLVYLLLFALGVLLIGTGAVVRAMEKHSWLPEVCIALGVAIAAPGILSYLYRKYMLEEIKVELRQPAMQFKTTAVNMLSAAVEKVTEPYRVESDLLQSARRAGIYGVYYSRGEALWEFSRFLERETHEIMIIGSSLRGLLQDFEDEYDHARKILRRRLAENVRIRVLVTHPVVADLRAKQEDRNFEDIGNEIVRTLEILVNDWKLPITNIKLYVGTPTVFAIKTTETMLLNTYPYMKEAVASPCIIVRKPGYMYEHFLSSHFRAWNSAMAVPPLPTKVLLGNLTSYAERVKEILRSAGEQETQGG